MTNYPKNVSTPYSDAIAAAENSDDTGIRIGKWKGYATFICVRCGFSATHRIDTELHKCAKAPKRPSIIRELRAKLSDAEGKPITHITTEGT